MVMAPGVLGDPAAPCVAKFAVESSAVAVVLLPSHTRADGCLHAHATGPPLQHLLAEIDGAGDAGMFLP